MDCQSGLKKQDPTICCLQATHFKCKDTNRSKVKVQRKIYHANTTQKKVGVAILILDKDDLRTRKDIMDKKDITEY